MRVIAFETQASYDVLTSKGEIKPDIIYFIVEDKEF